MPAAVAWSFPLTIISPKRIKSEWGSWMHKLFMPVGLPVKVKWIKFEYGVRKIKPLQRLRH
jgi:hypothetical protein